jgi:plasmid stability protein
MAVLNIRNIPARIHSWLRVRAARNGRSMEAEVRSILTREYEADEQKVSADRVQEWVDDLYGSDRPRGVVDDLIAERRRDGESE